MMRGRLIAVVGPSGVGKDSVMSGLRGSMPQIHLVQRVITRPAGLGGEDYRSVSEEAFRAMVKAGEFAVHWRAHGLHYGIPVTVGQHLEAGTDCLVNFSRKALAEAATIFPEFVVLKIIAKPETLARRLATRGRETELEIARRLSEAEKPLPLGLDIIEVSNDEVLSETIARAIALLQPVRA